MNYQGYLTDGSGNPLNGTYTLTLSLYDIVVGGTQEWGPEVHANVQVENGLFHVVLGDSEVLYPDVFDEALFLAVEVNGALMSPRQPVRTVAYAFGLVPGAEVEGEPENGDYALLVTNTGEDNTDRGLYVGADGYGIYAEETGDGNVGIYSPDFVHAKGYKSNDDSYWWYDANGMVTEDTLNASYPGAFSIHNAYDGGVELDCYTTGKDLFILPLDVPGELFGQDVRLEGVTVYYRTTDAATYIDRTWVYKSTGAGEGEKEFIAYEDDNQNSITATSYNVPIQDTKGYTLTSSSGNILALFSPYCDNTDHNIYISGVRLRLGHTD
jgi:hypothetical protein